MEKRWGEQMEIRYKKIPDMVCITISGDHKELCKALAEVIRKENYRRRKRGRSPIPYIINMDQSLRH